MNKLSKFLVVAIAISSFLAAFSQRGLERHFPGKERAYPMLEPGDKIVDMVITTGVKDAFPLWSICAPKKVDDHLIMADCGELSYDSLAIGHTLGVMDLIDPSIDWEELNWKMFVNGHLIDLEAFGVYDFVHPDFPSKPSPFREVFKQLRVWDVVLVNLAPGMHRIHGQAQSPNGAETYTWVVDFTVTTPLRPVEGGETQNFIYKSVPIF